MKNYHKAGMISPARVYACLDYLVKNHPAYKNIQIEKESVIINLTRMEKLDGHRGERFDSI